MAERNCVVGERVAAADGVITLTLQDADGEPLPPWTPGAHIDLLLTPALTRQYSLCGDPGDCSSWRIGVLREPAGRGGSAHVHDELHPGSVVRVRGPRNNFELVEAERLLFVAGGIGITPILPMVAEAAERGTPWALLYGGRSLGSMAFVKELSGHGNAVSVRPQDEYGCSTSTRCLVPLAGIRRSTAVDPSHCSQRWRRVVRSGRADVCTLSALLPPRASSRPARIARSRSSWRARVSRSSLTRTSRFSTPAWMPASTLIPRARRVCAQPARPTSFKESRTIGIRSSTTPSGPPRT
jgi:NAD(P)H-flavin reductase